MNKKIIYHHRTQGHGAEGIHITSIIDALRNINFRVKLISPPGIDPYKTAGKYIYSNKKNLINKIWKLVSKKSPQIFFEFFEILYNFTAIPRIIKEINKQQDIILFERYAFFMWCGSKCAKQNNIKYFLEVNEISGIDRARPLILKKIARYIEKKIFASADSIFVVSSFLKNKIIKMGIASDKIVVLPNGVDTSIFYPEISPKEIIEKYKLYDKKIIGFVGWIDPWDNMPWLINAFKKIESLDDNVVLMIVGDFAGKNTAGKDELIELIKKSNLLSKIIFTGKIEREIIPQYIAAMDICLIPDSNPFGSPVVLLEFMAMGKPVVAPILDPITDVIEDEYNGVLFKQRDEEDFKERIMELLSEPELRQKIGKNARAKILNERTWQANAREISNYINKVI